MDRRFFLKTPLAAAVSYATAKLAGVPIIRNAYAATWTVKQSGGDYSSLAAALSNASTGPGDLISIEGSWTDADTSAATVEDDNITIIADNDSAHDGYVPTVSPTCYRLEVSDGSHALTISNTGCLVENIIIKQAGTGTSDECIRLNMSGSSTFFARRVILWAGAKISAQDGIYRGSGNVDVYCENCMGFNFGRAVFHSQPSQSSSVHTWTLTSCSALNNGTDQIRDAGGITARATMQGMTQTYNLFNCVFLGTIPDSGTGQGSDYWQLDSGSNPTWNIDYCIDSDNSIADRDSGALSPLPNRTATENANPGAGDWVIMEQVTTAPYDLRLQDNAAANDAQESHSVTDGPGNANMPPDDIARNIRTDPYDRGAFEISHAAVGPPTVLLRRRGR